MRFRDAAGLGVFAFVVSLIEKGVRSIASFSRSGLGGLVDFFHVYI